MVCCCSLLARCSLAGPHRCNASLKIAIDRRKKGKKKKKGSYLLVGVDPILVHAVIIRPGLVDHSLPWIVTLGRSLFNVERELARACHALCIIRTSWSARRPAALVVDVGASRRVAAVLAAVRRTLRARWVVVAQVPLPLGVALCWSTPALSVVRIQLSSVVGPVMAPVPLFASNVTSDWWGRPEPPTGGAEHTGALFIHENHHPDTDSAAVPK